MRALTVQQPWAWAIVHGGKDVENRTQAWSYRGPLAIHAGARFSDRSNDALVEALGSAMRAGRWQDLDYGAVIGVVDLVAAHTAQPEAHAFGDTYSAACCDSPWAETSYVEHVERAGHHGRIRRDVVHLVLENPRPLEVPIPCKGRLGLWTPDAELLAQIREQMPA